MLTLQTSLAEEHIRDLLAAADRSRLIAVARCCRTAVWQRAATRVHGAAARFAGRVRRGQVAPVPSYCASC